MKKHIDQYECGYGVNQNKIKIVITEKKKWRHFESELSQYPFVVGMLRKVRKQQRILKVLVRAITTHVLKTVN